MNKKRLLIAIIIIFFVLLFDQTLKWYIKTHFILGEEYKIFDWFYIHFTENPGMAFGLTLSEGVTGKLILSLLRIVVAIGIGWYLYKIIKEKTSILLIVSISFIWAGAIGNIIDNLFYGLIYSSSEGQLATLFPDKGYAGFLQGRVVDMLYFPIIESKFPDWFPFFANESFVFFRPVFNIADASITIGVLILFIFYRKIFPKK